MKETMKEVVITGPKQYEVREVPVPHPGDGEVLIQMKAAGVCGSDVHQFLGENPNAVFPRVPGHENAGVIVEVGKDVKNVKVGDHVVVDLVGLRRVPPVQGRPAQRVPHRKGPGLRHRRRLAGVLRRARARGVPPARGHAL